ncbi:site-2 protease family protein [Acidobacteria bacterium AH-259-L09]|nr:site-2 protease family protein [Acidobacteria bacterium AH-259-L09]
MEPSVSRADIRFHLWGIPVRVHPFFWPIVVFLGWGLGDAVAIASWVGAVFVSILVHEMGHAQSARQFGHSPRIVLYGFGGLAIYHPRSTDPAWHRIVVLFCGPGAGFLFAAVLITFDSLAGFPNTPFFRQLYAHFLWINIAWGLLNLLPIFPLDGGQIAFHGFQRLAPHRGATIAAIVSVVTAGVMALLAYSLQQPYLAIFFVYFAVINFQNLG